MVEFLAHFTWFVQIGCSIYLSMKHLEKVASSDKLVCARGLELCSGCVGAWVHECVSVSVSV